MHKKYDIPNEFYKIYTFEIDDVIIYETYKKNFMKIFIYKSIITFVFIFFCKSLLDQK